MAGKKSKNPVGTHTLQLYSTGVDKYAIHSLFLSSGSGKKSFYVTQEDKTAVRKLLAENELGGVTVLSPTEFSALKNEFGARVVVDCSSLPCPEALEKKMIEMKYNDFLCTYDTSKTGSNKIKELVAFHDKLVLSTPESTVLSYSSLRDVSNGVVEKFIKNDLETVVLALVNTKPMTGMDVIKLLHKEFGTMVSPGRIYPVLHELEKSGLLTCECELKSKVYKVKNAGEVKQKLAQHIDASRFLSKLYETNAAQEVFKQRA